LRPTMTRPPTPAQRSRTTAYSDACWGSQIGNSVQPGRQLPLFKFRSMSGAMIFRMGGPLSWKAVRQEKTSLSSCEAEIRATNEGSKLMVATRNFATAFASSGITLSDFAGPTKVYNDNESCVTWANSTTTKGIRHMELRENSVREWIQDKILRVLHVTGKCNPSDIFTKEMKDGAHFRRLRDSFMSPASAFIHSTMAEIYRRQSSILG
jgi:hypothetical protein